MIRLTVTLFVLLSAFTSCGGERTAAYSTKVKYRQDQAITFPDFSLEYVGERRVTLPVYPRGFLYYDFKVRAGKEEKQVSWSSGTGLIGPIEFSIGGANYTLELKRADKLGQLKEDELVITKK